MNKFLGDMLVGHIGARFPEFHANYYWELQYLFEDENCPPHIERHPDPKKALDHMIALWNNNKTLIHISVSRRNA